MVIQFTIGYLKLPEEIPHLIIVPVYNRVDSNEVRISLSDITSSLFSKIFTIRIVFSRPHDNILKIVGFDKIG